VDCDHYSQRRDEHPLLLHLESYFSLDKSQKAR
jgi:hypothetical protein